MSEHPVIYVDIYATERKPRSERDTRPARGQRWRWRALNASNNKKMATSGEAYTNEQDCLDAIHALFGGGTNVYLRQHEKGNEALRMAAT